MGHGRIFVRSGYIAQLSVFELFGAHQYCSGNCLVVSALVDGLLHLLDLGDKDL